MIFKNQIGNSIKMEKLINYSSAEGKILKELFQTISINPYIALIVESFIYKQVVNYWDGTDIIREKYLTKYEEKEGLYQSWYLEGQKEYEYYAKEGKIEGMCQKWYAEGQKRSECYYRDGEAEGIFLGYHRNGQKGEECYYKEGKKEGLKQTW